LIALVNEAYLQLIDQQRVQLKDRALKPRGRHQMEGSWHSPSRADQTGALGTGPTRAITPLTGSTIVILRRRRGARRVGLEAPDIAPVRLVVDPYYGARRVDGPQF
jgi:hypothetical protein